MRSLQEILDELDQIAPLKTAEDWDNVGLLLGDPNDSVSNVMTCLTVTDCVLAEAIEAGVDLLITHHPIPFKPLKRITSDTTTGRLLLTAARNRIAIYSPHTAWDNADEGINQQLASTLSLTRVQPLVRNASSDKAEGCGRMGQFESPTTIASIRQTLLAGVPNMQWRSTHQEELPIRTLGIICGSGGSFVAAAQKAGCEALLTGEATYHQCLEGESLGVALLLMGHFASEAFAMKKLAAMIAASFPDLSVRASEMERSEF
ncbi:MAG: Nif3-like dinuclear metal center hexameric protein [Pirellula sp.]|jgi:dinuclear metal center YbgI/SA1388 family protein|nr:Nif3-like dinuclear metal center hexameric protein [Pirellula sp.]